MSLKQTIGGVIFFIISTTLYATPPVEVVASCLQQKAVRPTVSFNSIPGPSKAGTESGCGDLYQTTLDDNVFIIGSIMCDDGAYIILNGVRYLLKDAVNYSVNHSIKPGFPILPTAEWSQIEFDSNYYLCIETAVSDLGEGSGVPQYYLVENALGTSPVIYFYLLDNEVMPLEPIP